MKFLQTVGAKLLIALLGLLAIMGFVLRLIGIGEQKQKAKTLEAQRDIEKATEEAAKNAKQKGMAELNQTRANVDRGDFSDFNAD